MKLPPVEGIGDDSATTAGAGSPPAAETIKRGA